MLPRSIEERIATALSDTPAVLVLGARQVGKSTLVRAMVERGLLHRYVNLDDLRVQASAVADPESFAAAMGPSAALDEVQRAPDLLVAIKRMIDEDRRPGRFLLTGSANVRFLPSIAESLAGRIELVDMSPLSQGEIDGRRDRFVDAIFKPKLSDIEPAETGHAELFRRLTRGGFPEIVTARPDPDRRGSWFDSYVDTVLQRQVRDIANIEGLLDLPRILALVAARSGTLVNFSNLASDAGLPQTTLRRYFEVLRALYLVDTVPAWVANPSKRLVRSPKVYVTDSGLAAHLLGADAVRLGADHVLAGRLVEAFVLAEIRRQITWSKKKPSLHHFRTHQGHEVDAVLELRSGEVVGIEVKLSASLGTSDARGLRALAEAAGPRFRRGILLYCGPHLLPIGDNVTAVPISALWTWRSLAAQPPTAG